MADPTKETSVCPPKPTELPVAPAPMPPGRNMAYGSWLIDDRANGCFVLSSTGEVICTTSKHIEPSPQEISRARLISVAPEMLEEIKRLRLLLIESARGWGTDGSMYRMKIGPTDNLIKRAGGR